MKINVHKINVLLILFALCLGLIGMATPNNDGSATATTGEKDNADADNLDSQETSNIDDQDADQINDQDTDQLDVPDPNLIQKDQPKKVKKVSELVFEETSETVYATVNVNVRTSYTTEADNVIALLKKGTSIERIGLQEEWSKVLYKNNVCYIKTNYLTLEKPAAIVSPTIIPPSVPKEHKEEPSSEEDFISNLSIATDINQLVCIIGNGGSDCTVSLHVKDKNGTWQQQFSIDGDCGSKGISYDKKEGDNKTPAGLFSFTLAFGIKSDPGALLAYRQITNYDYWIDDGTSPYYNTWINSQETPGDFRSEHLIDHNPSYHYALHLNYNSDCTPGLGSAIFLHGYNGSGSTTGCIAIEESYVKTLVQTVDSSTKVLIVPNSEDLDNY